MTTHKFTLEQIERALDAGDMQARMSHGHLWNCRRNGKTQTWKTRPGQFRIPVKAGFRTYGEITDQSVIGIPGDGLACDFMINTMCPTTY